MFVVTFPVLRTVAGAAYSLVDRYPILQSIPTYHSLIGVVFLYKRCVRFQAMSSPCILMNPRVAFSLVNV